MILEDFFAKKYESKIHEKMMYYSYCFPYKDVLEYIQKINSISIESILDYIYTSCSNEKIQSQDVFQFSNIEDATYKICEVIKSLDNPGLKFIQVGKSLLNDGKIRKEGALTKYGENHAKTATAIGLLYEIYRTYFLSIYGYVINDLPEIEKEKLMTRLLLRNKLVIRLLRASVNGNVSMRDFLYMLSDATYIRRRSNIKTILGILKHSTEYDFTSFINKIIFN